MPEKKSFIPYLRFAIIFVCLMAAFNPARIYINRQVSLEAEFWFAVVPFLILMLLNLGWLVKSAAKPSAPRPTCPHCGGDLRDASWIGVYDVCENCEKQA